MSTLDTKMLTLKIGNTEKKQSLLVLQKEMLRMLTLPPTIEIQEI